MKSHKDFHTQLIRDIKLVRLSTNDLEKCPISNNDSIAILNVTSPSSTSISRSYSDEEERRKVTYLSVRSNNRDLSKCKVEKLLKEYKSQKLINYKESDSTSLGSKGGFSVNLNNKTIVIVFKFKNGLEKLNFRGWNEPLTKIFEKKPNLKRVPSDRNEREQLEKINKQITTPIILIINGERFKNVVGLVGGKSGQKSDFTIINSKGLEIGWISYKSGKTSTSFQQYSGLTEKSKLDKHSEVQKFYNEVKNLDEQYKLKDKNVSIWKPIQDRNLKRKSVFGHDYGGKNNENNVNFLIQGSLKLEKNNGIYTLKSSNGLIIRNGDLSKLVREYEPTLGIRSGEKTRKYAGIEGKRGGIWPKKYITDRKNSKIIDKDGSIDMDGF